jgi:Myb-like DNA-binding protein REB1
MNGTRSRIQCRYKWNKIVKRDALARVSFLEDDIRLWLFEHIKSMGYNSQKDVDWGLLAKMHNEKYPHADPLSATDLQFGFDKLRSVIREHRMYEFPQLMDQLIRETRRSVEEKGDIEDKDRLYLWG